MKEKIKNLTTVILVSSIFLVFFLGSIILPDKKISENERRELKQMPKITISSIKDGSFMTAFRDYTADQFIWRDGLRTLKAYTSLNLFNMKDNNGYYYHNGHLAQMQYPMNNNSIDRAAAVFKRIYERDLKGNNTNIYISIIPDKNFTLAKESGNLHLNYNVFSDRVKDSFDFATYIDLYDLIQTSDFYRTDLHIRQEKAVDIASRLCEAMGGKISNPFRENILNLDFYGVYSGHSALNVKPDKLIYLTNEITENCKVYDYETETYVDMYTTDDSVKDDVYSMFLKGSKSLLRIESPKAATNKKLIIFRDSFASNIAPLMTEAYSEIILIDIRYMSATLVSRFIDYSNSDILIMYSVPVFNNSKSLKN